MSAKQRFFGLVIIPPLLLSDIRVSSTQLRIFGAHYIGFILPDVLV